MTTTTQARSESEGIRPESTHRQRRVPGACRPRTERIEYGSAEYERFSNDKYGCNGRKTPTLRGRHAPGTRTNEDPESRRRGATAVEFAIVLPLLLLLALGAVDFGRIAETSIALNSAAGNGADYAATHRFTADTRADWEAQIREAVRQDLEHITDFDAGSLNTTITTATQPDQSIQVTIEATYPFRTAVDWPALPHETLLRQRIVVIQYR